MNHVISQLDGVPQVCSPVLFHLLCQLDGLLYLYVIYIIYYLYQLIMLTIFRILRNLVSSITIFRLYLPCSHLF